MPEFSICSFTLSMQAGKLEALDAELVFEGEEFIRVRFLSATTTEVLIVFKWCKLESRGQLHIHLQSPCSDGMCCGVVQGRFRPLS